MRTIGDTAPGGLLVSLDQGAATTIGVAFDPKLVEFDMGGKLFGYFADCQLGDHYLTDHAKVPEIARMQFDESQHMLGIRTGLWQ